MIKKKSKKKPSPAQLAARAKFIKAVKSGAFRKKTKGNKKPAKKLSGLTTYIAKKAIKKTLAKKAAKVSGNWPKPQTELFKLGQLKTDIEICKKQIANKELEPGVKKYFRIALKNAKKKYTLQKQIVNASMSL